VDNPETWSLLASDGDGDDEADDDEKTVQGSSDDDNDDDDDAKTLRGIERVGSGASTHSVSSGVSTVQVNMIVLSKRLTCR
jgi:hypothetical protein